MPASVPGQMPYAASPFASDYDAAQNAALRQKRLAEMLQQQALAPSAMPTVPGAKMSWLEPLSKALQGGLSGYMGGQADDAEKAAATSRQSALQDLLNNVPQDIPATPGTPGTPDVPAVPASPGAYGPTPDQGTSPLAAALAGGAPPTPDLSSIANAATAPPDAAPTSPITTRQSGGSDMVPGIAPIPGKPAVPVTPQQWAAYGAKFLPLGPAAAKIGEQYTDAAVKQMLPKAPPALMPVGNDIYDPVKGTFITGPTTLAKTAETKALNEANIQARADALAEKMREANLSDARIRELASQHADLMRELHASQGGGEKGNMPVEGASANGNPVVRNSRSGIAYEVVNGVPSKEPYAGPVTAKTDQSKGIAVASKGAQGLKDMTNALNDVEADDKLFGGRANLGAAMPSAFGVGASVSGLSQEQMAKKAQISSMTADVTHSLYGSAFSAGEQARAKSFLIDPMDSSAVVKAKLRGRMALEQEHYNNLPASARAASTAQRTGTSGGGAVPDDGWGVASKQH